ncbi:carbon-nitrogen hydrolase family protein [Acidithiobacillus sp. IBUN Pt1247-S3]|uniref:carbon-nitrogen hydrolase family protein n=1 Tax=Acidithiobacillus sp. IBUN Pt1247-S3 TaxID=3166642 RepID=UPI0034E3ABD8
MGDAVMVYSCEKHTKLADLDLPVRRVALWQCAPSVVSKKGQCVDVIEEKCALAKESSVDILIFPEMYLTGYAIGPDMVRAQAEVCDGESAQKIAELAITYRVTIVYGYPEIDEYDVVYNSVNIISAESGKISVYRKRMLFGDVDRAQFSPGNKAYTPVDINGVKYGIAICYDIEFPELARELTLAGADVILVPTANMQPYESVADRLVPARAQENGVFVIYANYYGKDNLFDYFGKSTICDPLGDIIAREEKGERLLIVELDINKVTIARKLNNYVRDCQAFCLDRL